MISQNLFTAPPGSNDSEKFLPVLETPSTRIERIVSHGHASPPEFWYDQPDDEWVILLKGEATMRVEPTGIVKLRAGSHLFIPKHQRHRVEFTSADAMWLAVHMKANSDQS